MTDICVVGLGRMGSALARAFLAAGHSVRVWNRSSDKAAAFAQAHGATAFTDLAQAVSASDLIVMNVLDYAASEALLQPRPVAQALAGKTLLQLASGSPRQAREQQDWAQAQGAAYLDGAIMATPNFIGETALVLYSGSKPAFQRHGADLAAFGAPPVFVGEDAGHASALDIALLTAMWGALFGVLQGLAVCRAEGLGLDVFAGHLGGFRPVIDLASDDLLARVGSGRDLADDQTLAGLSAHFGAFQHLREVTALHGLNRALPDAMAAIFERAVRAGHAEEDFAIMARFMDEAA